MATGGQVSPRRDEEHDGRPGAGLVTAASGVQQRPRRRPGPVARFVQLAIIPFAAVAGGLIVGAIDHHPLQRLHGSSRPAPAAPGLREPARGSVRQRPGASPSRSSPPPRSSWAAWRSASASRPASSTSARRASSSWAPSAPRRSAPTWRSPPPISPSRRRRRRGAARCRMGLHPRRAEGVDRRARSRHDDHAELHRRDLHRLPHHRTARGARLLVLADRPGRQRGIPHALRNRHPPRGLIAFGLVPVVWWLLWRSTLGFEIRTVGANPDAARYAGMRPRSS